MRKMLLAILLSFLVILSCGTDSTGPVNIEPVEYINNLPDDVWFQGIPTGTIFVSKDAFNIVGSSETTYAFIKVLATGKVIVAMYIKKDGNDKIVSATRDETIGYAKKIISTLENFSVTIPEVPAVGESIDNPWGSPAIPAYTIKRELDLSLSKYRIINKPYVYNGEKVYDYYCTFQTSSQYEEDISYINIVANITASKIRLFQLRTKLVGGAENFYYKEGKDGSAEDKLLTNYLSEVRLKSSYDTAVEFLFVPVN